jgi:transcription initiation factor TFIID subunit 1, fungi type
MATNGHYTSDADPSDDLFEDDNTANMADTPQESSFMDELNEMAGLQEETTNDGNELNDILGEGGGNIDLNTLNDLQVGGDGEKADDALDYGDISDDDLAEDEPATGGLLSGVEEAAGMDDDDMNDLFGEGPSSPPTIPQQPSALAIDNQEDEGNASELASDHEDHASSGLDPSQISLHDATTQPFVDPKWILQQSMLAEAIRPSVDPQKKLESAIEACKRIFPEFSRDEIPFWNRIIKPRMAEFTGKTPLKPPKSIRPTKVHLEVQQDQKAIFNSAITSDKRYWEDHDRMIVIENENANRDDHETSDDEVDIDDILPGGVTMEDLDLICADFDTLSDIAESDLEIHDVAIRQDEDDDDFFGHDDDWMESERPAKRRKMGMDPKDIVSRYEYSMPSFDDPEHLTEKIARKVVLDLNDPLLLTEEVDPATVRAKAQLAADPTKSTQNVKELLRERFNYSNDADYDLLKQNHQHKIRSTLGHLSIEHSVPALRLQYPYYQVKLATAQARTFHRPSLTFRPMMSIHFTKVNKLKRKHQKGRKARELYASTKDLTFGDNSISLLMEYSEEHPMILSQVGMGCRIINYYRRQTKEDASRPKLDIGETAVLLPEDKSPFSLFGHIDPGETVTAVYNSMYRAPLFEHEPKAQDFLVIRSHTGMHGSQFFMRNIDHIYSVGQEFPSVSIPGPHSRVVTTASKNRLKMISYRIARRKKNQRISVGDVTKHFPDTTDMQNRQKMKEFMVYSKEHKEWEMKLGEPIPDEEQLQQLVRPEDVSLLESMQVGQQYLYDAGFGGDDADEEDDDKEGQGQSIEQELAPWKTSKNFLNASQGKAMLTLHGDGDPSGRGEAFSFLKTSMKGGFKAIGESAMSKMEEKKELGGHSYNVARQQRSYEESIRRIWDAQKTALSSTVEHSDIEMDDNVDGPDEDGQSNVFARPPPRSEAATPAPFGRRDDESATSFSKRSTASQTRNRVLRITRKVPRNDGGLEDIEHIERDPTVIKQYLKKRNARNAATRTYAISQLQKAVTNIMETSRCSSYRRR